MLAPAAPVQRSRAEGARAGLVAYADEASCSCPAAVRTTATCCASTGAATCCSEAELRGAPLCLRCAVIIESALIEAAVSAAARRLAVHRDQLTADLLTLFAAQIAPLQHDDQLLGLLAASTEENVVSALHVLEHGIDPLTLDAPTAAKVYARRLAQRGIPVSALLRSYRLGHAAFYELLLEELTGNPAIDPAVAGAAGIALSRITTAYIDTVSELVVAAYEDERQAWSVSHSAARSARIRALLDGAPVDVALTESKLGYRLSAQHLCVLLWRVSDQAGQGDDLARLERVATAATAAVGAHHHLLWPMDEDSAAVWVQVPAETSDLAPLLDVLGAGPQQGVRAAVGRPATGLDGFRTSYRQASQARQVALAAGARAQPVTLFEQVGAVSLLCADLAAARTWVCDTLGPLAADEEGAARLRETLRVFLEVGSSYTAAAEILNLHKNSVQYRVQKAEQLRGRPLRADRPDVEFALRACHVLGSSVLQRH